MQSVCPVFCLWVLFLHYLFFCIWRLWRVSFCEAPGYACRIAGSPSRSCVSAAAYDQRFRIAYYFCDQLIFLWPIIWLIANLHQSWNFSFSFVSSGLDPHFPEKKELIVHSGGCTKVYVFVWIFIFFFFFFFFQLRILQEPKHNLIFQNKEMLKTEDIDLRVRWRCHNLVESLFYQLLRHNL